MSRPHFFHQKQHRHLPAKVISCKDRKQETKHDKNPRFVFLEKRQVIVVMILEASSVPVTFSFVVMNRISINNLSLPYRRVFFDFLLNLESL